MILKASKRGGARQLARHLMNGENNEHVTVHEISGFASDTVIEAMEEIHAISRGTKCSRFMFSLSLNPPQDESVPAHVFEDALERIEKKLGLEGQPRIIVFHEKHGRRHAHCVWSRIDAEEMKAIDQPYFKNKLRDISKQLYLDHGWKLPKGFIDKREKNPLNFTRAQWQQAARTNQSPKTIKAALQECWTNTDSKKSFTKALKERGYCLARGDRRGYVVVDIHGEVYSLARQLSVKTKELEKRLGKAESLPTVDQVKKDISKNVTVLFKKLLTEQSKDHQKSLKPLLKTKRAMTRQHRNDRTAQKSYHTVRSKKEMKSRVSRIRKGFKGLWDKLTGSYWKLRKQNEKETWRCNMRDRNERESLITKQLVERHNLQVQLTLLQHKHVNERQILIRDLSHIAAVKLEEPKDGYAQERTQNQGKSHDRNKETHNQQNRDVGFEPEI